jgi:hypothetical protein
MRSQECIPEGRLPKHRYVAQIVNWTVAGSGDTPEQARLALATNFKEVKLKRLSAGKNLPRPGTDLPVEFASQERVSGNPKLAEDFVRLVLDLDWALSEIFERIVSAERSALDQ